MKYEGNIKHMRCLFVFMCYSFLGALIFSYFDFSREQSNTEQRRQRLDKMINKFAQRITNAANDPGTKISVSTMKHYVKQAYAVLRDIDEGSAGEF